MALSSAQVRQLVEAELSRVRDEATLAHIRELLIEPYSVDREWYYGAPGQHYTCWTVLQDPAIYFAIAYCPEGFGPRRPWGFVSRTGSEGIGPDYEWYASLEEALKDSPLWDESTIAE
jgi:hypothetical protein